jgi:predicted RNA-binding protein YlqC (UPF0109 family)
MTELVKFIAEALVDHPEAVQVTGSQDEMGYLIRLQVASEDMGKVIGRKGRIAKAIRTVVKAASSKNNQKVNVQIISDDEAGEMESEAGSYDDMEENQNDVCDSAGIGEEDIEAE